MKKAIASDLESKNTTPQNEFKTSCTMHTEIKAGRAKDLSDMREDMGKNKREFDALKTKVAKLEKRPATMRNASKANEKRYKGSSRKWFRMP